MWLDGVLVVFHKGIVFGQFTCGQFGADTGKQITFGIGLGYDQRVSRGDQDQRGDMLRELGSVERGQESAPGVADQDELILTEKLADAF